MKKIMFVICLMSLIAVVSAQSMKVYTNQNTTPTIYSLAIIDSITFQLPPSPAGMRSIPGGTFQMGDTNGYGYNDDQPVHSVTISAFYMDTTDVTQANYQTLMEVNPSSFTGNTQRPVETVTWFDAVLYCNKRSIRDSLDTVYSYTSITGTPGNGTTALGNLTFTISKNGYRLPTEAEWEYACRAGSTTDYYWGQSYPPLTTADSSEIDANAVWWHNSPNITQPVATKPPNAFGLYDMAGNVWQLINDWYGSYSSASQTDPTGPSSGSARDLRGGSWNKGGYNVLTSALRNFYDPTTRIDYIGFRCVRR
jgi:formylglycine-generating enzyme required for sulfatase activity